SPHRIMSFAQPLGLGMSSEGEYVDIQVYDTYSSEESVRRLNEVMTDGLKVLSYRVLPEKAKGGMSVIKAADYMLWIEGRKKFPENASQLWNEFLQKPEILATKESKKGETTLDIKPHILDSRMEEDRLYLRVSTGSEINIKPDLVFRTFCAAFPESFPDPGNALRIHRIELYADDENGGFISLEDMGDEVAEGSLS
ncbi:MAG: TIGR03936 family radical SAM-associated protein, partial [Lachnospiraceae bacterium]|nr:TIGR03936 family radical SAM-associated protein [Lachnospiraceae bacterium]